MYQMHSNHQNPIEFVEAGDICAAVGFKDLRTGDTICNEDHQIVLESMNSLILLSVSLSSLRPRATWTSSASLSASSLRRTLRSP